MDLNRIEKFIDKQKVSFICSIDEEKYPNVIENHKTYNCT